MLLGVVDGECGILQLRFLMCLTFAVMLPTEVKVDEFCVVSYDNTTGRNYSTAELATGS